MIAMRSPLLRMATAMANPMTRERGHQPLLAQARRAQLEDQRAHFGQGALGKLVGAFESFARLARVALQQAQRGFR